MKEKITFDKNFVLQKAQKWLWKLKKHEIWRFLGNSGLTICGFNPYKKSVYIFSTDVIVNVPWTN